MLHSISQVAPLIIVLFFGYGLKSLKLLTSEHGGSLLRVVFYAGSPALVFHSISQAELEISALRIIFFPPIMMTISIVVVYFFRRNLLKELASPTFGSLIVGVTILNTGVLIPFVDRSLGDDGLARFMLVNTATATVTYSLVYGIAARIGSDDFSRRYVAKRLLFSPPLWACILALAIKGLAVNPPVIITDSITVLSELVSPAILLAVGLKFSLRLRRPSLLAATLALRFGLGTLIGIAFVYIVGLQGMDAIVVLLAGMAPVGFNSITFSELENLDTEFAVAEVSAGLILGVLLLPFILHFLPRFYL